MNITSIIAIICITALLALAVANGINGAMMAGGIAIIAALGGYKIGQKRPPK